jgi:hypothetical protein
MDPQDELFDRAEAALECQRAEIDRLRGEIESLRDRGGNNGVAIKSLVHILTDGDATVRTRLRAASTVLAYKVLDAEVNGIATAYLEALCANVDVPADLRIEASETLRKYEAPKILPEITRPSYRPEQPAEPVEPLADRVRRMRAYDDRVSAEIEKFRDPVTGFFSETFRYPETPSDE